MPKRLSHSEQRLRDEMWQKGLLWCSECKTFYPVKKFYRTKKSKNYGYRFYCIECEAKKRLARKSQIKGYFKDKNLSLKQEAVKLMGGKCQRCGFSQYVTAMDFHHVYPATKKVTPTILLYNRGIPGAWKELDKCCLLCRNCHGAYTGNEWRAEFIKRDGLGWTVGQPLPLDDNRYETTKVELQQTPLPLDWQRKRAAQLALL